MPFDTHKNLAIGTVLLAPIPPNSGTSLTLFAGHGIRFPAANVPFNCTIWPASQLPSLANAEIVRVTAMSGDIVTAMERAVEGTARIAVQAGYLFSETITAKALTDIESGTNFPLITTPGPITSGDSVTAPVGNFGTLNALHAPTHAAGGTDPVTLAQGQITGLPEALASIEGDVNTLQTDVNAIEADVNALEGIVANGPVALHAANHKAGGSDPLPVTTLPGYPGGTTQFLRADGTFAATPINGGVPALHAPTHAQGGTDPVDVKGLTGYPGGTTQFLRADKTFATPTGNAPGLHAPTHAIGGSDPVVKTFRTSHTWGLVGDVSAITKLPYMWVQMAAGQTVKIVALVAALDSGTSVGVTVYRNGVAATGVITVSTGAVTPLGPITLVNQDYLHLVLSAPVGTPTGFSASLVLEHTV